MRSQTRTRKQSSAVSDAAQELGLVRNDRGIVLVLALLVMLVLSALGSAFLFLSGTETLISHNSQVVAQAFFAAEAGIETALNTLPNTAAIPQTGLDNNIPPNVVFQTGNPDTDGLGGAPATVLGASPTPPSGYNVANFSFNMFRVDVSGTVTFPGSGIRASIVQLRMGATVGSPLAGTGYN